MEEWFRSSAWDLSGATEIRPETPAELHQWIRTHIRTETGGKAIIPTRRICQGHSAPFEFVSDAFFGIHNKQFVHSNRNGGKTFNFGAIAFTGMWHYGRGRHPLKILNAGAIEEQAKNCFKYTSSIWRQPEFIHEVNNGRGIWKTSIVLPNETKLATVVATINGLNSPHVPWMHMDEWELWDWDLGQQAFSIPKSSGPHKLAVRIASTQKYALGNVQRFKDEAPKRGFKVYKWCIWETIEQCRDRSCSSCPIFMWPDQEGGVLCGGRAKHARGFYEIDDFIDKVQSLDRRTLEEEWLCLRPSREGLVFGREFNEDRHRVPYEIKYRPNLPLYITIDQGFTNPFAVLISQLQDNRQLQFLDELYQTEKIPEEMGKLAADKLEALGVESGKKIPVIPDREDPAAARTFIKHLVSSKGTKYYGTLKYSAGVVDLEEWLRLCRRRLKLRPDKQPDLIMSNRLTWFPWELTQYRYKIPKGEQRPSSEKPLDKDNHAISAWYRLEAYLSKPAKATSRTDRFF